MSNLTKGWIKVLVNGTWRDLPIPAKEGAKYEVQTFVDAARDATGTMIGNEVGLDKIGLTLKYPPLTDEEFADLLSVFDKDRSGAFKCHVSYYDPRQRRRLTKYMYVGNRSGEPCMVDPATGVPKLWRNVQCDLVEI